METIDWVAAILWTIAIFFGYPIGRWISRMAERSVDKADKEKGD